MLIYLGVMDSLRSTRTLLRAGESLSARHANNPTEVDWFAISSNSRIEQPVAAIVMDENCNVLRLILALLRRKGAQFARCFERLVC